jgi:hypothetical protein
MALGPQNRYGAASYQGRAVDQAAIDEGLRQHMLRIYNYMSLGLAVSGLVALAIAYTAVGDIFFQRVMTQAGVAMQPTIFGWIGILAPLGILLLAMFAGRNWSARTIQGVYWAFVALQGIGLSILFHVYTDASIASVFFITAAAFAGLSLFGYTTKRSLSGIGSFAIMGLIGIIIASVVNIFLMSDMLQFIIAAAGVLIFSALIAYDTQRIKEEYVTTRVSGDAQTKVAVWNALALYINFINLLQFLLYFLGNRE